MSALDELLEMEKERKERIKRIDSLIYRVIHEESKRLSEKLIDKMRNGELGLPKNLLTMQVMILRTLQCVLCQRKEKTAFITEF